MVADALHRGDPVTLANCIGISPVVFDRLMAGFLTSESALEAANIIFETFGRLATSGTYASRPFTLASVFVSLLNRDFDLWADNG